MKYNRELTEEVLRIKSLMGIKNINKAKVVLMANLLLNAIPRTRDNWKTKTKIVLYTEMIITGVEHHKQVGVEKLKEILSENPDYCDYYLGISERLMTAANR